jgi:hypothetical protein
MNPGISISFGTQETHNARRTLEGNGGILLIPEQSGGVIALTTTTNAHKRAVCRFFPIKIPARNTVILRNPQFC